MFPASPPAPPAAHRSFLFASRVVAVLNALFLVSVAWRYGLAQALHLQLVEWLGIAGYLLAPLANVGLHLWLCVLLLRGRLGHRKGLYAFNFLMLLVQVLVLFVLAD